jgi:muramoyltetrapeptide carboxypeptidase
MLNALTPGGTVGVVAPAAPIHNRSDVLRGIAFWEGHGFRVKLSESLFSRTGYFAGEASARASALEAMFRDPEVDAVQAMWGGSGSTLMIPHIDWAVIRENPKPFIGRSDITSLHLAIARYAQFPTLYGPGFGQVAPVEPSAFTQQHLLRALTLTEPLGLLPRHPKDGFIQILSPGKASGELAGGCLWPLCKSIGTDWQPDFRGKIVFLEEVDEPPWSIDAHLTHLKQAGLFKDIAGVLIGRLVNCEWSNSRAEMPSEFSLEEVLERHFGDLGVPVLYRLPCGHEGDTLTLPLGVRASIHGEAVSIEKSIFRR